MNPFVNLKKRGVSLPSGCKDLIDVLDRPKRQGEDPSCIFIRLILMQAHDHRATELVIGSALAPESTITEKVGGTSFPVSSLPSDFRSSVIDELGRMAGLPAGPFPKEGEIFVRLETIQLRWKVQISSPDGEIVLTPSTDDESSIA
jgi:hypothetical protein